MLLARDTSKTFCFFSLRRVIKVNLIDTHAHLEEVKNLHEAIQRAEMEGVIAIITMGSDLKSSLWSLKESPPYQTEKLKIYSAIGIHPWSLASSNINEALRFIEKNAHHAIAIGEIGLDYWYRDVRKNPEKKEKQRELFRRLLKIAKEKEKPVSIHSRGAWMDCVEITIEMKIQKAVFHWFSGPKEALKRLLDHGYYISATPAAKYSKEHRAAIRDAPLGNILLETDSPVSYRGEIAEPAHVLKSLSAVAEIKGESKGKVAEETTENSRHIFGLKI